VGEPQRGSFEVPLVWVGADEALPIKVNQFVVQVDSARDAFLTIGTATPPILLGDNPDDLQKQAETIGYVPIRIVGRFSLSATGLRELVGVLQSGLKMLERQEVAE